jgi:hypothetical protein
VQAASLLPGDRVEQVFGGLAPRPARNLIVAAEEPVKIGRARRDDPGGRPNRSLVIMPIV